MTHRDTTPAPASPLATPAVDPTLGLRGRFLALPEVLEWVGVSKSTLRRWVQEGRFPAGHKLGAQVVRWDRRELEAWAAARAERAS